MAGQLGECQVRLLWLISDGCAADGGSRAPAAGARIHSVMPDSMHGGGGQGWVSRVRASLCRAGLRRACAPSPARLAAGAHSIS
jgi:hypothetical protein